MELRIAVALPAFAPAARCAICVTVAARLVRAVSEQTIAIIFIRFSSRLLLAGPHVTWAFSIRVTRANTGQ